MQASEESKQMNALERLAHHVHRIREERPGPDLPDQNRLFSVDIFCTELYMVVLEILGSSAVSDLCVSNARSWWSLQPRTMLKPLVSWHTYLNNKFGDFSDAVVHAVRGH